MDGVTTDRVRPLSLEDLGVAPTPSEDATFAAEEAIRPLLENDEVLAQVRSALEMGFAGVILSGPPGTGKSWYASRIAHTIAGEPEAVRIVQFHTSYQYDDFMEGFAPKDSGGFELRKKTFPLICEDASERPDVLHILLIDEISRCDVARVFGEALTYVEVDKRKLKFTLASGSMLVVPRNLVIVATMNSWDKGVDELDIALERRFAQIDMPPSTAALRKILSDKDVDGKFIERVVGFFEGVQKLDDEMVHLGHAYFNNCVDEERARRLWDFRLFPFFKKACRLDKDMLSEIKRMWVKVFPPTKAVSTAEPAGEAQVDVDLPAQPPDDQAT